MSAAIFLSYASQDADAARRICDALRAQGVEVWFDQSELRGGDAWDVSIRKQIKECTLFVPVISPNTQARAEGYFRLEWRLADQRTHLMAKGLPFILPVAIEGTSEAGALVPDSFMEVQWTKLNDEASIGAFAARVAKLVDWRGSPATNAPGAAPSGEFAKRGDVKTADKPRTGLTGENWVAIVAVVFGIGAGVWFMANRQAPPEKKGVPVANASAPAAIPASSTAINPLSVMVMPFANQTGDTNKTYIADALTSSITSDLSRITDATIVPTATAFSLRDKNLTVPQLGKEASVKFVLTGGVTADKEKLRVNASQADTQTGTQLWSQTFGGTLTDLFAMQDQVTARIGKSIGPQMTIAAARESEKRASTPQVADLLLRASALELNPQSLANHQAMEALYRQALAIEPDGLRIKAKLARTLSLQAVNYASALKLDAAGEKNLLKQAFDLAQQVKSVDANIPEVYQVFTLYYDSTNDIDAAMRAAQRRIELQPKVWSAHHALGSLMRSMDDLPAAKAAFAKAIELASPARPPAETYGILAGLAFREDKLDDALAWAKKALDANANNAGTHVTMALALARKGSTEAAKRASAEAVRLNPTLALNSTLARSYSRPWPGKEAEFKKFIETQYIPAWRAAGLPE